MILAVKNASLLLTTRHKPGALKRASFGSFQAGIVIEAAGQAQPGMAGNRAKLGNQGQGSPALAWPGLVWPSLAKPGLAWSGLARPGQAWPGEARPGLGTPDEPGPGMV